MKSERRILISFLLNFSFTIIEFIGGIITNSVALFSDSIHDLGDSISMGIAIFLEKKSKKKPDETYTYGYQRFSLLGALISSIILIVGSTIIVVEAVKRLINPETVNSELLIYFAIFGVIVNGFAAFNTSKGKSMNEKVISLHLLEDVLGWVTLLIGAIVMHFTQIIALDAVLSIAFTVYIVYHVFRNMKKIFQILLERVPNEFDIYTIKTKLLQVEHIIDIHHIHLWTLEGSVPLLTLHVLLEDNLDQETISEVQNKMSFILEEIGIKHTTLQIEFSKTDCKDEDCSELKPLNRDHHNHHH